jgi:retron-type reverse transcriptase
LQFNLADLIQQHSL